MQRLCFDCEFFCPEAGVCRSSDDLTDGDWDECLEGECRRRPPVVGDLVQDSRDPSDSWRAYGEFPRVLAADWCGKFKPCARVIHVGQNGSRSVTYLKLASPETLENKGCCENAP